MRGTHITCHNRSLTSIGATLVTLLAVTLSTAPASADVATISGMVVGSSNNPQPHLAVNVLAPASSSTVTITTTDNNGDYSVNLAAGTYNLKFIPSSASGLQSYLAPAVSTDWVPLTVVLKPDRRWAVPGRPALMIKSHA